GPGREPRPPLGLRGDLRPLVVDRAPELDELSPGASRGLLARGQTVRGRVVTRESVEVVPRNARQVGDRTLPRERCRAGGPRRRGGRRGQPGPGFGAPRPRRLPAHAVLPPAVPPAPQR